MSVQFEWRRFVWVWTVTESNEGVWLAGGTKCTAAPPPSTLHHHLSRAPSPTPTPTTSSLTHNNPVQCQVIITTVARAERICMVSVDARTGQKPWSVRSTRISSVARTLRSRGVPPRAPPSRAVGKLSTVFHLDGKWAGLFFSKKKGPSLRAWLVFNFRLFFERI